MGESSFPTFLWDLKKNQMDVGALEKNEVIIHLAATPIAPGRWTKKRRKEILESRTRSSRLLYEQLARHENQVTTFISASAIGYYGWDRDGKVFTLSDGRGAGFLAEVVEQWEEEVDQIKRLGVRVIKLRMGMVLSLKGGALPVMLKPFQWGLGSPLGSGKQMLNWIHLTDLCRLVSFMLENANLEGPVNAVSPNPITNREMTLQLGKFLDKPIWLPPVPGFLLRLILGEMASIVLEGNPVSGQDLLEKGFTFQYPTFEAVLSQEKF